MFDPANLQAPPPNVTAITIDGTDYVSVTLEQDANAYWRFPTGDLSGNLLTIYGQTLTFDLVYYVEGNTSDAGANEASITIQVRLLINSFSPVDKTLFCFCRVICLYSNFQLFVYVGLEEGTDKNYNNETVTIVPVSMSLLEKKGIA